MSHFLRLLPFMVAACLHADSTVYPFSDSSKQGWSAVEKAKMYMYHSELQRQWACDLLGQVEVQKDAAILDVGCGDGKISAQMAHMVPRGRVHGIDCSEAMLTVARRCFSPLSHLNLSFSKNESLTFGDLEPLGRFDRICAFCVLHLVPRSAEALAHLHDLLKPGGRLLCVIPAVNDPIFRKAAEVAFDEYGLTPPWRGASTSGPNIRTVDGCRQLLESTGYTEISVDLISKLNTFCDKEDFQLWLEGTVGGVWSLPQDRITSFCARLVQKMVELDPNMIGSDGTVFQRMSRLHVQASRPL